MSWVVAPQCSQRPASPALFGDLADERQDRIADILGLALEASEIEGFGVLDDGRGGPRDRRRRLGRDHAEPGLGAGERGLDLGAAGKKGLVAEHRAHRRGAEHVAEDRRVEDADRHQVRYRRGNSAAYRRDRGNDAFMISAVEQPRDNRADRRAGDHHGQQLQPGKPDALAIEFCRLGGELLFSVMNLRVCLAQLFAFGDPRSMRTICSRKSMSGYALGSTIGRIPGRRPCRGSDRLRASRILTATIDERVTQNPDRIWRFASCRYCVR